MRRVGVCSGVAAVAIALACAGASGCSVKVTTGSAESTEGAAPTETTGPPVPVVAKADLEKSLADRLTEAGQPPQSVACAEDLQGVVDTTTRCEVVLSESNAIEPVVTVTGVDGDIVNFDVKAALSQEQLQDQVAMLMNQNSVPADTVSCEQGLEGVVGSKTRCTVEGGGDTTPTVVEVTEVDNFTINFRINPA